MPDTVRRPEKGDGKAKKSSSGNSSGSAWDYMNFFSDDKALERAKKQELEKQKLKQREKRQMLLKKQSTALKASTNKGPITKEAREALKAKLEKMEKMEKMEKARKGPNAAGKGKGPKGRADPVPVKSAKPSVDHLAKWDRIASALGQKPSSSTARPADRKKRPEKSKGVRRPAAAPQRRRGYAADVDGDTDEGSFIDDGDLEEEDDDGFIVDDVEEDEPRRSKSSGKNKLNRHRDYGEEPDWRSELRNMFGSRRRQRDSDDDDEDDEDDEDDTGFDALQREEERSARIARLEDKRELHKEMERKRLKKLRKDGQRG